MTCSHLFFPQLCIFKFGSLFLNMTRTASRRSCHLLGGVRRRSCYQLHLVCLIMLASVFTTRVLVTTRVLASSLPRAADPRNSCLDLSDMCDERVALSKRCQLQPDTSRRSTTGAVEAQRGIALATTPTGKKSLQDHDLPQQDLYPVCPSPRATKQGTSREMTKKKPAGAAPSEDGGAVGARGGIQEDASARKLSLADLEAGALLKEDESQTSASSKNRREKMKTPVLYINLDRDLQRGQRMNQTLGKLFDYVERVPALTLTYLRQQLVKMDDAEKFADILADFNDRLNYGVDPARARADPGRNAREGVSQPHQRYVGAAFAASLLKILDDSEDLPRQKESLRSFAVIASHLKALRRARELFSSGVPGGRGDIQAALILEDDVSFGLLPFWEQDLDQFVASLPPDWGVVQVGLTLVKDNYKTDDPDPAVPVFPDTVGRQVRGGERDGDAVLQLDGAAVQLKPQRQGGRPSQELQPDLNMRAGGGGPPAPHPKKKYMRKTRYWGAFAYLVSRTGVDQVLDRDLEQLRYECQPHARIATLGVGGFTSDDCLLAFNPVEYCPLLGKFLSPINSPLTSRNHPVCPTDLAEYLSPRFSRRRENHERELRHVLKSLLEHGLENAFEQIRTAHIHLNFNLTNYHTNGNQFPPHVIPRMALVHQVKHYEEAKTSRGEMNKGVLTRAAAVPGDGTGREQQQQRGPHVDLQRRPPHVIQLEGSSGTGSMIEDFRAAATWYATPPFITLNAEEPSTVGHTQSFLNDTICAAVLEQYEAHRRCDLVV
ncbi:unnamed protein product [Amoebophrya sp. A120]|nr:unnamed protein product [Amoebophrya sp. A120]|eukprot:GSA120T00020634001.1